MDNEKPSVGMGATVCYMTDRHAGTVVAVSTSGREVTVQRDRARLTNKDGIYGNQEYEYSPNPEGSKDVFTLRKNGRYYRKGEPIGGLTVHLGARREYYDPSF